MAMIILKRYLSEILREQKSGIMWKHEEAVETNEEE